MKILTMLALSTLIFLNSGCATTQSKEGLADNSMAELYEGKPTTMFATQLPVTSAAEGIKRGDYALRAGQTDLALYMYVQALQYDSANPNVYYKIGVIHERRGNSELAKKALTLALQREASHAAANETLGMIYLDEQAHDKARDNLQQALVSEPGRWRTHNGLGVLADLDGNFGAALAHYDEALAIVPDAPAVLNNRGYSLFLAGDLEAAEQDFRRAATELGLDRAWRNLGLVYASRGDYRRAFESFLEVMEERTAYHEVGRIALESGEYAQAVSYLEKAIHASPLYFGAAYKDLAKARERSVEFAADIGDPTRQTFRINPERQQMVVRSTALRVRDRGDPEAGTIGYLHAGDPVAVLGSKENWLFIEFHRAATAEKAVGWVHSRYLQNL